ncbi:hypothetical protein [Deinococcus sp.]|nr:hypothetical protein [Deinococcus sp.]
MGKSVVPVTVYSAFSPISTPPLSPDGTVLTGAMTYGATFR